MTRICCLVTDRMTSHDHRGHPRRHATLVILLITRKGDQGRDRPDWPAGERPPAPYSPFDLAGRPTVSRVAADELNADVSTGSVRWVADPTRHAEPRRALGLALAGKELGSRLARDLPATARCRRLHSRDPRHSFDPSAGAAHQVGLDPGHSRGTGRRSGVETRELATAHWIPEPHGHGARAGQPDDPIREAGDARRARCHGRWLRLAGQRTEADPRAGRRGPRPCVRIRPARACRRDLAIVMASRCCRPELAMSTTAAAIVGEHGGPHRATRVHRPGPLTSYEKREKFFPGRGRAA